MALRDVNLVPEAVLQRRYLLRHASLWALAGLTVMGTLAGAYAFYTRAVLTRREPRVSEAEARRLLSEMVADIDGKMQQLEHLAYVRRVSRPGCAARALDGLAAAMDPQTWLTGLSLNMHSNSTASVVASGLAGSNAKLGSLIGKLSGTGRFRNVVLMNASEASDSSSSDGAPVRVVAFTVQAEFEDK